MNRGLMVDLDGTIRKSKSGKVTPNEPSDQEVLHGRYHHLHAYRGAGFKVIAITNQGGIGLGHTTDGQVKTTLAALNNDLGRVFHDMLYEGSAPKDNHPRRKPNPGMILEAAEKHNLDLKKSLMVGDLPSDKEAAEAAGVPFAWAKDFFGTKRHYAMGRLDGA